MCLLRVLRPLHVSHSSCSDFVGWWVNKRKLPRDDRFESFVSVFFLCSLWLLSCCGSWSQLCAQTGSAPHTHTRNADCLRLLSPVSTQFSFALLARSCKYPVMVSFIIRNATEINLNQSNPNVSRPSIFQARMRAPLVQGLIFRRHASISSSTDPRNEHVGTNTARQLNQGPKQVGPLWVFFFWARTTQLSLWRDSAGKSNHWKVTVAIWEVAMSKSMPRAWGASSSTLILHWFCTGSFVPHFLPIAHTTVLQSRMDLHWFYHGSASFYEP